MVLRCLLSTLAVALLAPTLSHAQTPISFNAVGICYRVQDESGRYEQVIPYTFLALPHFVQFCGQLTASYLLFLTENEDRRTTESPGAGSVDAGLLHLYQVARRCEENGDVDMACNCYTEIVRLRPDCGLAVSAEFQCRRLQLVQQVLPGLQRNSQLSTALPR